MPAGAVFETCLSGSERPRQPLLDQDRLSLGSVKRVALPADRCGSQAWVPAWAARARLSPANSGSKSASLYGSGRSQIADLRSASEVSDSTLQRPGETARKKGRSCGIRTNTSSRGTARFRG